MISAMGKLGKAYRHSLSSSVSVLGIWWHFHCTAQGHFFELMTTRQGLQFCMPSGLWRALLIRLRRGVGSSLLISQSGGLSTDAGVGSFQLLGAVSGVGASRGNSEDGGKNAAVHDQTPFLFLSNDHATAASNQIASVTSEYSRNQ
jgi:hypothetical protein